MIAILHADDPAYVHEAAKRGVFAYIVDGTPDELQSAIDITLQRFSEYQSLQGAFGRRAVIEQAKGILMARHAINADAAFERSATTPSTTAASSATSPPPSSKATSSSSQHHNRPRPAPSRLPAHATGPSSPAPPAPGGPARRSQASAKRREPPTGTRAGALQAPSCCGKRAAGERIGESRLNPHTVQ